MSKKLKHTNVNDLIANTNDVASIFYDIGKTDKELNSIVAELNSNKRKKEDKYAWVYNNLRIYGNVFVSDKTFSKLDEEKLGNYTLEPVKKIHPGGNNGYIIWKN